MDFNLTAKCSFCATRHGKQPCDGIGGTMKRLEAKDSLQKTIKILTTTDLLEFCRGNIMTVSFLYAEKKAINQKRGFLPRIQGTCAVPGTSSFHQFVPVGEHTIATKRCSDDNSFVLIHSLYCQAFNVENVHINDFVSCLYENTWWIGLVMEIDNEQTDVRVKFMHPHGPTISFH